MPHISQVTDSFLDIEEVNEMSRSSSVSTKDRAGLSKKAKPAKQRRDDNESFDVRSQYTPFFPQQHIQTWSPSPQYSPLPPQQFNGGVQTNYQSPMTQQFVPPNQPYPQVMMNNGNIQAYNNVPQVSVFYILFGIYSRKFLT
jgi:hypothetical protein